MENEIKIFESEEFGKVRTVVKDGEPWLVGKDVADILEYRNGSRDINRHVDSTLLVSVFFMCAVKNFRKIPKSY